MTVGLTVPKGRLPVYSVDDWDEAQNLVVLTCARDLQGNYYSEELARARQTPATSRKEIDRQLGVLQEFSDRLDKAHEMLKSYGHCKCVPIGGPVEGRTPNPKPHPGMPCVFALGRGRCSVCGEERKPSQGARFKKAVAIATRSSSPRSPKSRRR